MIKVYMGPLYQYDILKLVYKQGIKVPKPLKIVKTQTEFYWCFVEWLDGDCKRNVFNDEVILRNIDNKYYFELGKLLGEISNITQNYTFLTASDVGWWNYIMIEDTVKMIDVKKWHFETFPEKYICHCIIFHEYIPLDHKLKFIDGYISKVNVKRTNKSLELLKVFKIFSEKLYEKLA